MSDEKQTCSRPGCSKPLRKHNSSGQCSSNCLSPEAPPAKRAKGVEGSTVTPSQSRKPAAKRAPRSQGDALERFRTVMTALGKDPEEMLAEFAEEALTALRTRLEEGA